MYIEYCSVFCYDVLYIYILYILYTLYIYTLYIHCNKTKVIMYYIL